MLVGNDGERKGFRPAVGDFDLKVDFIVYSGDAGLGHHAKRDQVTVKLLVERAGARVAVGLPICALP